jgi:hypothetical protein
LLERQTQLLANLHQLQLHEREQMQTLLAQNQALIKALEVLNSRAQASDPTARPVKIADVNMPFWSLVGFIVKASLAAIPAYIVLGVVGAILFLVLGGCVAGIGQL